MSEKIQAQLSLFDYDTGGVDQEPTETVDKAMQEARWGDFSIRNSALLSAATAAGRANMSGGAAQLHAAGIKRDIINAADAGERSVEQRDIVYNLAKLACQVCPLREFCETKSEEVAKRLLATGRNGQNVRSRLIRRIDSKINNNYFCQDNLSKERLPKN